MTIERQWHERANMNKFWHGILKLKTICKNHLKANISFDVSKLELKVIGVIGNRGFFKIIKLIITKYSGSQIISKYVYLIPCNNVFSLILWCNQNGDHSQDNLTKYNY
jgi:hypothetical protein